MREVSLLILNASQLVRVPPPESGGAKRGGEMAELGIIESGAVAVDGSRIVAVGTTEEISKAFRTRVGGEVIDASGCVVAPAFVDPHTHALFAGTREWEFEERLRGVPYMEIAAKGGGIHASVRMFRQATDEELLAQTLERLDRMAAFGTATVEIKTGYGLDPEQELRALRLLAEIRDRHMLNVVVTYLGAHEIPQEFTGRSDEYVALLTERMIPEAAATGVPRFCDVFCEKGVFSVEQSRVILEAGKRVGLRPKIHADEIAPLGGAELAVEVGAVSADHLGSISERGIEAMAHSDVVAVLLPGTVYSLGLERYAPARRMIEAGVPVAISTDCNPGSSMVDSMPLVISLSCLMMDIAPAEALTAATYNAAAALGLENETGSLSPGYRADIQIIEAPSYARLPYHLGSSDLKWLIVSGRIALADLHPAALRRCVQAMPGRLGGAS